MCVSVCECVCGGGGGGVSCIVGVLKSVTCTYLD